MFMELSKDRALLFLPDLKRQYTDIKEYFNTTEIKCDALIGSKVAVNAEGLVLPCNFFNHNLYDMRFKDDQVIAKLSSIISIFVFITTSKNRLSSTGATFAISPIAYVI